MCRLSDVRTDYVEVARLGSIRCTFMAVYGHVCIDCGIAQGSRSQCRGDTPRSGRHEALATMHQETRRRRL